MCRWPGKGPRSTLRKSSILRASGVDGLLFFDFDEIFLSLSLLRNTLQWYLIWELAASVDFWVKEKISMLFPLLKDSLMPERGNSEKGSQRSSIWEEWDHCDHCNTTRRADEWVECIRRECGEIWSEHLLNFILSWVIGNSRIHVSREQTLDEGNGSHYWQKIFAALIKSCTSFSC